LLANRAFLIKMGLLLAAGCNAGWFHARGSLRKLDALARQVRPAPGKQDNGPGV
jgi:hypothetical protein